MMNYNIQYFVIITEQRRKNKYLELLVENDAHAIDIVYGYGSLSTNPIAKAFGLDIESNKVIISCLIKTEQAKKLIDILYQDYNFNKPNTGIAFSILVECLSF